MDRNNGLEVRISKGEITIIITTDLDVPPIIIKISLQDQTPHMGITTQTMEDHLINAQINHSIETMEIDPEMDPSTIRMETGGPMETFLAPHQIQEETSHKNNSYRQPRGNQPNNSAFRRSDNQLTTAFTPYEQKFPQNNNQTSSNVSRFTTTNDTINELSDLCPLNY